MIPNVDVELRIVMNLPLRELWRDDGFITAAREKSLTGDDVGQFLASGPVQFVVADVAHPFAGFQQVNASVSGRMRQNRI
jgi:hypothetical protein